MTIHIPVLSSECIDGLQLSTGDTIVDGTLGGGGHAQLILQKIGESGRLIGFDRDPVAIENAQTWATANCTLIKSNYADIPEQLAAIGIDRVDGIVLDLGLSSDQLADRERGFSFQSEGPLDLRFDATAGEPAFRLINRLGEKHLADLIYRYGEEKFSRRIARKICATRHNDPIKTADQLADLVRSCIPRSQRQKNLDPATRTFQALRIGVNDELKWLKVMMKRIPGILATGGRAVVISFHSLEDRIVKTSFVESQQLDIINRKPILASEEELNQNPRARSAKLRVAERNAL